MKCMDQNNTELAVCQLYTALAIWPALLYPRKTTKTTPPPSPRKFYGNRPPYNTLLAAWFPSSASSGCYNLKTCSKIAFAFARRPQWPTRVDLSLTPLWILLEDFRKGFMYVLMETVGSSSNHTRIICIIFEAF